MGYRSCACRAEHAGVTRMWSTTRSQAAVKRRWRITGADLEHGKLGFSTGDVRRELAGKNLACWCRLDQACHADILLEVANS